MTDFHRHTPRGVSKAKPIGTKSKYIAPVARIRRQGLDCTMVRTVHSVGRQNSETKILVYLRKNLKNRKIIGSSGTNH